VTSGTPADPGGGFFGRSRNLLPAFGPGLVWAIQPFTTGVLVGDALDPTRHGFRGAVSWMAWLAWLAVLIVLAVPRPLTLTLGRIGAPAILPAAAWAAINVDSDATIIIGVASAAAAALVPLLAAVGERFVDAASYGDEQRFPLRPPGPVLLLLLLPTWALTLAAVTSGPLLLADRQWVGGVVAVVAGVPAALVGFRALSRLTSRFLVFVPNGIVIHDQGILAESVLFRQYEIAAIGPARADTTAEDITSQALGMALELRFTKPVTVPVVTGRAKVEEHTALSLMVSASRPAAVLEAAARRGFVIG